MRNLLLIPTAIMFLFSCNENDEQVSSEQANYRILFEDTVRIDAKDELLFVSNSLGSANYLPSTDNVYNFNSKDLIMEVYNIESQGLVSRHPFEREGPNAVGQYITGFEMLSEEAIFIFDINFFAKYNLKGDRLLKVDMLDFHNFSGDSLLVTERLMPSGGFYGEQFITIYTIKNTFEGVAFLDFQKREIRKEMAPEFDKASELSFSILLNGNKWPIKAAFEVNVGNKKAILSSDAYNEIVVFDMETGERSHKIFKSALFPNQKVPKHTAPVMEGDAREMQLLLLDQITFGSFQYDETNKLFYRISYMANGLEGEQKKYRRFLSIFDQDLNHLQDIGDLPDDFPSSILFIRNGKMHSFLNENDEIAFTVMSVVAE